MADRLQSHIDELVRLRPEGARIWDAHTHLGDDEDGMSLRPDRLLAMFDRVDLAGGCVFPLHDPQRAPSYHAPNDRVLASAARSWCRHSSNCTVHETP